MLYLVAAMFVACGGDSSSNSDDVSLPGESISDADYKVSEFEDLPQCTSKKEGATGFVFVTHETYVCKKGKWILDGEDEEEKSSSSVKPASSSSNESGKPASSSAKEESSSSVKQNSYQSLDDLPNCTAKREGELAFVEEEDAELLCHDGKWILPEELKSSSSAVAESSSSKQEELTEIVVNNLAVMGSATKGPFEFGSPVYIYELYPDNLEKRTGREYKDEVSSNQGNYVIPKVTLYSPYAELVVEGKFLNEFTGKNTAKDFTLRAIADLKSSQESNINLLTHLQADRILTLVKKGYTYAAAKKQAEQELMTSFGLSNTVSADRSTIYNNATMMAISLLFVGDRSESEIQKAIDNYIEDFAKDGRWNDSKTKSEMADWVYEADWLTIHKHVDAWNITGIADFHKEVLKYRDNAWGLGGCTQNRNGEASAVENESSKYYHQCFVCESRTNEDKWITDYYTWHAKDFSVCDTYGWEEGERDEVRTGLVSGDDYAYNGTEWIRIQQGQFVDERDGKTYKTISIGNQTWMAENLNYDYNKGTAKSYVNDDHPEYGRYYTWAAAMDSAAVFSTAGKGCGYVKSCSTRGIVRGACPEGWHLPSISEWETLYKTMGRSHYAMQATGFENWSNATDAYGFSALPAGGYYYNSSFGGVGSDADFWSATEYYNNYAYDWYLDASSASRGYYANKNYGYSVRCLQD